MKDLLIHKTREKIPILNWNREIKESIFLEQFDHVILIVEFTLLRQWTIIFSFCGPSVFED